ncbi:MAG: dihydroorotate dehydrogenase [Candidatus Magasanikbacteria bacterium CG10_big_fil_rev_8_21_14_0_10_42_10]|uniref:Dihydroorotate dehydrogenase n=2 Tax=Candidatus Magasanikiibacteriota TaxID=1752731 RepID=A0A2H0TWJ3_9BACT|nr:MAG: dihydroorotate dehydrogenase [Candidatus Magasanikbacteria bacterium CG10_big_fil_rev_8_21_14_0_10_42_10]PIZ94483.1 MAG: dihydroorotate dehydrogenase [Candidatus Magasanikbacteria bacterium CG_4_10_14_0_2_um_filter_41_10]
MSSHIPEWFGVHPPIYDITKSYTENAEEGPFFDGQFPERIIPSKEKWIDFLGHNVMSPLGVPAGPLLNSKYIALAAKLGFDVLTYKTIRSAAHDTHPIPNMIYIDVEGPLPHDAKHVRQTLVQPHDMEHLAVTNSFGMGCYDPTYLLEDIANAKASLADGQVLNVSVVGTQRPGENFVEDFAKTAALAKEAGADVITANFSCPNVGKHTEGSLYMNPEAAKNIASRIVKEIGDVPLIIKMGYLEDQEKLKNVLTAIAKAGARGVCGINTVGRQVVNAQGQPALGPGRETSGICGGPIRTYGLEFVQHARHIIDEENLGLTLLGVGGVVKPEHFGDYLSTGADIAMSATGMMWDPYLAMRWHDRHNT